MSQPDKFRQTLGSAIITNSVGCLEEHFCVGKSYLQTSGRAKVEHFVWEIPIYQLNLLLGGAFHVENFYLQTQLQRFVWEIPIYKLNWSVSCGKFLFTNPTGAFRVGNFYLQTQLWCVFPIYKLFTNLILKGKSIFQASDPWSEILQSNSGFLYARA